jgi:hypothetical protein
LSKRLDQAPIRRLSRIPVPMDDHQSSEHPSRTHSPLTPSQDMATMVIHGTLPNMPGPNGINKRYRPAPAKTFQCRGYGECRMVFSRSEHLARHIRSAHFLFNTFSCTPLILSSQKTYWGTSFHMSLWQTIFSSGQPAPTCTDRPCR